MLRPMEVYPYKYFCVSKTVHPNKKKFLPLFKEFGSLSNNSINHFPFNNLLIWVFTYLFQNKSSGYLPTSQDLSM